QVECGNSAISTAPYIREFSDPSWVHRMKARYEALGAQVIFVWVYCDPPSMHTYLRRRGAARDSAKLADWEKYVESIDLGLRPPVEHVLIENSLDSAPLQTQASQLIKNVTTAQR